MPCGKLRHPSSAAWIPALSGGRLRGSRPEPVHREGADSWRPKIGLFYSIFCKKKSFFSVGHTSATAKKSLFLKPKRWPHFRRIGSCAHCRRKMAACFSSTIGPLIGVNKPANFAPLLAKMLPPGSGYSRDITVREQGHFGGQIPYRISILQKWK